MDNSPMGASKLGVLEMNTQKLKKVSEHLRDILSRLQGKGSYAFGIIEDLKKQEVMPPSVGAMNLLGREIDILEEIMKDIEEQMKWISEL